LIEEDDDNNDEGGNNNNNEKQPEEHVQPFQHIELEIPNNHNNNNNDNTPSGRSNRTGIVSELTTPTMASSYTNNKKEDRTQRPTMSRWHSIASIISSENLSHEQPLPAIL